MKENDMHTQKIRKYQLRMTWGLGMLVSLNMLLPAEQVSAAEEKVPAEVKKAPAEVKKDPVEVVLAGRLMNDD